MIRCQDCGAVMEDGLRFCPQCGASMEISAEVLSKVPPTKLKAHYCGKCGAKLSGGKTCLICGTRGGELPAEQMEPHSLPEAPPQPYIRKKNRVMVRTAALLSLLLILAGAGAWALQMLPDLIVSDKVRADNAILFVQGGNTLRIKSYDATEASTIDEQYAVRGELPSLTAAQASHSGRYLAYLNNITSQRGSVTGDLYVLDLSKVTRVNAKPEEAVLVAQGVTDVFAFGNDDACLVFLTAQGDLCAWDFQLIRQLEGDVEGIYDVGSTKVLYYLRESTLAGPRVVLQSLDGETRTELGAAGRMVDWTDDFAQILYTERRRDEHTRMVVYDAVRYTPDEDRREILVSGVYSVVDGSAADGRVLFVRRLQYQLEYELFVDDDMAQLDARLAEPSIEQYPILAEYYEANGDFPEEREIPDGEGAAYEALVMLYQEYEYYQDELREYDEKRERDRLRERLQAELDTLYRSDVRLYEAGLFDGTGERTYSDLVVGLDDEPVVRGSVADGYLLYATADFELLRQERVVMSRLNRSARENLSAEEMLLRSVRQQLWYTKLGAEPVSLFTAERAMGISEPFVSDDAQAVYFRVLRKNTDTGALYYSSLSGALPAQALLIDRAVQLVHGPQLFNGQMLYFKDCSNGVGNLYGAQNGTVSLLAYDVSTVEGFGVYNGGKTLMYYENYDSERGQGTLFMTVQQRRQLSGDIRGYFYKGDDLIYLLKGVEAAGGDLYAYSGGVLTLVDSGVTGVLPMDESIV